jgi:hypothetical protein
METKGIANSRRPNVHPWCQVYVTSNHHPDSLPQRTPKPGIKMKAAAMTIWFSIVITPDWCPWEVARRGEAARRASQEAWTFNLSPL